MAKQCSLCGRFVSSITPPLYEGKSVSGGCWRCDLDLLLQLYDRNGQLSKRLGLLIKYEQENKSPRLKDAEEKPPTTRNDAITARYNADLGVILNSACRFEGIVWLDSGIKKFLRKSQDHVIFNLIPRKAKVNKSIKQTIAQWVETINRILDGDPPKPVREFVMSNVTTERASHIGHIRLEKQNAFVCFTASVDADDTTFNLGDYSGTQRDICGMLDFFSSEVRIFGMDMKEIIPHDV
jgi:hypothetical protein